MTMLLFARHPDSEAVASKTENAESVLTDASGARIDFLSPERVEVAAPRSWIAARELHLLLDGQPTPVSVRVESWARGPANTNIGVLAPLDRDQARTVLQLSTTLRRRPAGVIAVERVQDAVRIRRTLSSLADVRAEALTMGTRKLCISLLACLKGRNEGLLFLADDEVSKGCVLDIELVGPLSLFRITVAVTDTGAGFFRTAWPTEITRKRRRKWLRGELAGTYLMVRHPWFDNDKIRVDIKDVSFGGVGLQGRSDELLLYPGLRLPEIELWCGDRSIDGPYRGEVKHAQLVGAGAVLLHASDDAAATPWLVYPRTTLDPRPLPRVWDLLVESGYLSLAGRAVEELGRARATYLDTLERLRAAPSVGAVVGWRSPGRLDGVVTMVRLYESSWMAYHLAKISGPSTSGLPGKLVLRDFLRHAHEHAMSQDNSRYVLSYVRDDAGWPKLLNVDFVQRYASDGQCFIEHEHAYLVPCTETHAAVSGHIGEVESPAAFLAAAQRRHGDAFCDAYDYTSKEWLLASVARRWQSAGLQRERCVFESRVSGQRAYAVVELASPGAHLYGLFDCVRIYHEGEHSLAAEAELLERCASWFRGFGRREFVFLQQDKLPAPARPSQDMGRFSASLIPVQLGPDYLEHLWEITSTPVRL